MKVLFIKINNYTYLWISSCKTIIGTLRVSIKYGKFKIADKEGTARALTDPRGEARGRRADTAEAQTRLHALLHRGEWAPSFVLHSSDCVLIHYFFSYCTLKSTVSFSSYAVPVIYLFFPLNFACILEKSEVESFNKKW